MPLPRGEAKALPRGEALDLARHDDETARHADDTRQDKATRPQGNTAMITTTSDKSSGRTGGDNKTTADKTAERARQNARQFGITSRIVASSALAGVLVFGIGGWAAQAKLSGAVITHGQVVVSEQVKTIQHRDGGIIAAIRVDNGTAVKKGDVPIVLDDTQTRVELSISQGAAAAADRRPCQAGGRTRRCRGVGFEALDLSAAGGGRDEAD